MTADDDIDFFAGTAGAFGPFSLARRPSSPGEAAASAVTEDPQTGRPVIAARARARGSCSASACPSSRRTRPRAPTIPNTTALLDRTWTLLSR